MVLHLRLFCEFSGVGVFGFWGKAFLNFGLGSIGMKVRKQVVQCACDRKRCCQEYDLGYRIVGKV